MRDWIGCVPTLPRVLLSIIVGFVAIVVCFPVTTKAQGARDYLNTPVGWSGFIDFTFSRAQSAASADLPLPNDLSVSRLTVPYFLYSFAQNKRYGGVSLTTPFIRVKDADGNERTSGFTDPTIAFHANIFGLPALTREEFAAAVPQTFLTVHLNINPPIGSYDRNRSANAGAHRWAFTPIVNLDITPDKGVSWIDLYAQVRFFTDNNKFQGDKRLSQKPLLTLSGFYSHNIGKKSYAALGTNYDYGGETSVDNVPGNNTANGFRPGVAVSRVFGRVRVTLHYENTSTRANDARRNSSVGIKFAYLLF
jgi:hypothetical protein